MPLIQSSRTDTQMKWEGMLEDINGLLNSGEVPGLFPADERAELCDKVSGLARAAGLGKDLSPAELFAYFVERVKRNLHIVLAMSPIGDAFRDRLRKFPSLVNCCTIDWFTEWPEEALESVAVRFFEKLELKPRERGGVVKLCVTMQRSVTALSAAFLEELGRCVIDTAEEEARGAPLLGAFREVFDTVSLFGHSSSAWLE